MIKTQFTLYLEQKPGALASVARKLADSGINIEGISVAGSTDVALLQIVVNEADSTARVLEELRIPFTTQRVAVLPIQDTPGELAGVAERLAARGVNIHYIYGTTPGPGGECRLVVSAPDLKEVERLWARPARKSG